ncbi:hypothetical protein GCM10010911_44010 [Paenibacillus nasutitermitis]|uniref:Uncharacterized protein n=1 Tax=Paenibacillus nasutitermitis TaxID=1652958 RepID=A0A916Z8G1_9BACL|nr:hypothetical protein GCM10010911_44010 [Paenibacillus nasutitermitis]
MLTILMTSLDSAQTRGLVHSPYKGGNDALSLSKERGNLRVAKFTRKLVDQANGRNDSGITDNQAADKFDGLMGTL